jgi:hypothetical protein
MQTTASARRTGSAEAVPHVPAVAVDQDRSPALAEIVGAGRVGRVVMVSSGSIWQAATLAFARGAERGSGERAPIAVCPRPADMTPPSSCTAVGFGYGAASGVSGCVQEGPSEAQI